MKVSPREDRSAGFAVVEALLILVILAAIVGVGAYVVRQKHNANSTLGSGTGGNSTSTKAPAGTTTSIDQLTQQDAQTEAGVDAAADNSTQQTSTSANGAASNVGGAYNETNL